MGSTENLIRVAAAEWLEPLTALAMQAGQAIREIAKSPVASSGKADGSPVTEADLAADRIIAEGLARIAPGIAVVSEERASDQPPLDNRPFFLVDPLDGTREFIAGRDEYTVNIALVSEGRPVLGIVGAPALFTLWRGIVGLGTERVTHTEDGVILSTTGVAARHQPADHWVAAVSRSHLDAQTKAFIAARPGAQLLEAGSALKFCWVAQGDADIYPRLSQTSEWDVAAGHAVVCAAGGEVTTPEGQPMRFGQADRKFLVPGFIVKGRPPAA